MVKMERASNSSSRRVNTGRAKLVAGPGMASETHLIATLASEGAIEVHGCLTRTEWELVYLAARSFAQAHGLHVDFELRPVELEGEQRETAVPEFGKSPDCEITR